MTIAAAYLTSEGVVLGADSMTSVLHPDGTTVQLIGHGQKLFEVGQAGFCGLCTYGDGEVAGLSHRTIAALLGDALAKNGPATPEETAKLLVDLVEKKARERSASIDQLGYLLAGVDQTARDPWLITVEFDGADAKTFRHSEGPVIAGSDRYYWRVFKGHDPELQRLLLAELTKKLPRVDATELKNAVKAAFEAVAETLSAGGMNDLPIREAIDFVHTYLHLTVKADKFRDGLPACGGPVEVAFITTDRPFRWARHKQFDSAILEQQNYTA